MLQLRKTVASAERKGPGAGPPKDDHFDLVIAGTGFASTFFLLQFLKHASPKSRVLVIERGVRRDHAWSLANPRDFELEEGRFLDNRTPEKRWWFTVGFGGGSNCWFACTPRLLPEDFGMQTTYGVGVDWPLSYAELEPFYCDAEDLLGVAGANQGTPFTRSRPYPLPPHRMSRADEALARAWPGKYFIQPTARPSITLPSGRPGCCNNGVCNACPIDSKFTIRREMSSVYADSRVSTLYGAELTRVTFRGNVATGVEYALDGKQLRAQADFVALGTNALFNPHILLRSGVSHPALGRYLNEQRSASVDFDLDGINNFQGSTVITGHGYMFYSGEHRREHSGALLEHVNRPMLRLDGKWRQRMRIKFIFEDLPQEQSQVSVGDASGAKPKLHFSGFSSYCQRATDNVAHLAERLVKDLPVTKIGKPRLKQKSSEAHILGTARMGKDPKTSVVDRHLLHHRYRNLAVLGSSSFPTSSPANPSLTICALSLWAGRRLFGGGA